MLKQVIYNYVDLDGTMWNTLSDGKTLKKGELTDNEEKINPSNNLLSDTAKRLSLQARPGTFFKFKGTDLMITNSGIFNYEGQATELLFPSTPSWFILDYETEDEA